MYTFTKTIKKLLFFLKNEDHNNIFKSLFDQKQETSLIISLREKLSQ